MFAPADLTKKNREREEGVRVARSPSHLAEAALVAPWSVESTASPVVDFVSHTPSSASCCSCSRHAQQTRKKACGVGRLVVVREWIIGAAEADPVGGKVLSGSWRLSSVDGCQR